MILPVISTEQYNVIQQLLQNNNVVVDSVAGSGKTTCNLHIAKYFTNMNILLLTYNSKLKIETREKVKLVGIHNIEAHSYHSFCVKYYDYKCFTDTIIHKIIENKNKPSRQFKFDLIVLDEAQDITSVYYELICKIYKDNQQNAQVCIFGDRKQSIFDFNEADQRFIKYADELFNFNSNNWIKCNLSVSFRITYEMSLFINNCLLKEERIISNKITNNKPRYIICDCFGGRLGTSSRTFEEVKYYFNLGYKPSDIFILAPAVKGVKSPVRQLENKIKREMPDVMVYVPITDDEELDKELLEGKIVFSTFHQTKGLERKVVIIFNFDSSYFKYYGTDANRCICPNEFYVATTRGIEHLTLFHHHSNEYLHFIDKTTIPVYCHFECKTKLRIQTSNNPIKLNTSPTDIIKFLPQNVIDECYNQLEIIPISRYIVNKINIPLKITNDSTTESVSEITGTAIPSMFEFKLKNRISIFDSLQKNCFEKTIFNSNNGCLIQEFTKNKHKKYNMDDININDLTPGELLYISNCWNAYKSGFLFKIYQIDNYDWLERSKLDESVHRLTELDISKTSSFEYEITIKNEIELLNRKLIGYIDCLDNENNIIYEFKCVQNLEKEHYLQLAIYMYMYELHKIEQIEYIIYTKENGFTKNKDIKNAYINHLLQNTQLIKEQIRIHENKIANFVDNVYEKTDKYSIGDTIKYKLFEHEECGVVVKLFKRNDKIQIKDSFNLTIKIPKSCITSVKKSLTIEEIKTNMTNIECNICKLHDELEINNKLINETTNSFYSCDTKYVLFNILTNEYVNVKCDIQKLKKMIETLMYSKYINNKPITDTTFIDINKNIYNLYFG